ncbi:hypothetical protein OH77DRAFT_1525647 [Trametes cingulata]|nr:hypothetical protein OH77DRAFT_1525647 [Trametes cingulata]
MPALYPRLAELEPFFVPAQPQQEIELFAPFPLPVSDHFPFAMLLNKYGQSMRLVPPNIVGPIEHPHTRRDWHKVPIYIQFPQHMPTPDTPWIMNTTMTPNKPLAVKTDVFLPIFGQGRIFDIMDLTESVGTLVVSPDVHPADFIYISAPRTRIQLPDPIVVVDETAEGQSAGRVDAQDTWPRKLRRAISAQFDKLRKSTVPTAGRAETQDSHQETAWGRGRADMQLLTPASRCSSPSPRASSVPL